MHSVFPTLSTQLMQTPAMADGDATLGPTAGPSYEYSATGSSNISEALQGLKEKIESILAGTNLSYSSTIATLKTVRNAIDNAIPQMAAPMAEIDIKEGELEIKIKELSESTETERVLHGIQDALENIVDILKDRRS